MIAIKKFKFQIAILSLLTILGLTSLIFFKNPTNQPVLKTTNGDIFLEVADTPTEQAIGLMFRQNIEKDRGMIFIFEDETERTFWMKDTFISLDIIFLNSNFIVQKIYTYTLPNQTSETYFSIFPAKYVIEIAGGRSTELNIREGDRLNVKL